jgi:hypothetical protein
VSALERLEQVRTDLPAVAGTVVGLVADNPAQFAMILSGSYVVTRGLARMVRPSSLGGILLTATASYGVCLWMLGEARRRGVLTFKTRDASGQLVPLEVHHCADCQG